MAMADPVLRDLDPLGDRPALERLWVAAIGGVWPVLPAGLDFLRTGVVAEAAGEPVGVVSVAAGDDRPGEVQDRHGGVQLLLVDPAVQRRGIGTRLLEAGIERLRAVGVTTVALGSGGNDYLWPGVPEDLPGAAGFFAARGWRFDYGVLDLVADLRGFQAPRGTVERAERGGVSIEAEAGPGAGAEALAFEAATFPIWLRAFRQWTAPVLVARDRTGAIVGTLLFRGPPGATIFTPMLGQDAGTIGCVGVAASARGAGVGSAMVTRASELLRDAGTGVCHISWTEREWFYRRVGYLPWRRYRMAERTIPG
jgi:ribosomal protein S18 acetylase RimI-like enzyme